MSNWTELVGNRLVDQIACYVGIPATAIEESRTIRMELTASQVEAFVNWQRYGWAADGIRAHTADEFRAGMPHVFIVRWGEDYNRSPLFADKADAERWALARPEVQAQDPLIEMVPIVASGGAS